MSSCTLCGLPTPEPPVSSDEVGGVYCCRGCMEVQRTLGNGSDPVGSAEGDNRVGVDFDEMDVETAYLRVDGMHCSACETFIERRATQREAVVAADASYASDIARLRYLPGEIGRGDLPDVVEGLGYSACLAGEESDSGSGGLFRLVVGVQLGMMAMVWYAVFLYPAYFDFGATPSWTAGGGPTGLSSFMNLWLLTTAVLLFTGYPLLRGAYVSLRSGQPNMDLLVALAAVNAYVFSTVVMLAGGSEVYFDITVVIVLVVTLGNYYEKRVKRRSLDLLTGYSGDQGKARVRADGGSREVPVKELSGGEEIVVRAGERVPVDGSVVEGSASVDESLVTGESVPVRKERGDEVVGGSVVVDDAVVVRVGEDAENTLDRLVDLLWEVQSGRPGVQRVADRLAAVFVPLVVLLAAAAFVLQLALGAGALQSVLTGLAVLVVSCPCALGLATPLAVAKGLREGLDRGVVVRDEGVFEVSDVEVALFDKTGTLTTGEMRVVRGDPEALGRAAAVEQFSNHPVADAITSEVEAGEASVSGFREYRGRGVSGVVDGERVVVGSPRLFRELGLGVPEDVMEEVEGARDEGFVPVVVGWGGWARSVVVVGDTPRPGWGDVVGEVAGLVGTVAVVTGDEWRAAGRFRDHPDVDHVFAGVPPEAKVEVVDRLRGGGRVAMVGDGNNDAPALGAADLGVALGGTALAGDAADVVVTSGDLGDLPAVFGLARGARTRIKQNLGWAFLYNAVAVPVAVAGLINPLVAAVAMASSSLLVVGNSTRRFLIDR